MKFLAQLSTEVNKRRYSFAYKSIWEKIHLDPPLLIAILCLLIFGVILLYSATNGNYARLTTQLINISIGLFTLFIIAQIHPKQFQRWTSTIFWLGICLLLIVKFTGTGRGAQRWIDLGFLRFQPSEIMKCAVPMMVALQVSKHSLPIKFSTCLFISIFILIPFYLIFKQPDLGTALLIIFSGCTIFILAGLRLKHILYTVICISSMIPVIWHYMHAYQKSRILTFFHPEIDPLGSGYNIIQSIIAIGSGGLFGKGWLNGTQARLKYLPESSTDFIFALCAEEFGLIGCMLIIFLFTFIACRTIFLSQFAHDNYTKLLCGTLGITFFFYALVNIGMVSGIFPVVGSPLPLISYGGTAMISIMINFGIIMSCNSHRKLVHEN